MTNIIDEHGKKADHFVLLGVIFLITINCRLKREKEENYHLIITTVSPTLRLSYLLVIRQQRDHAE